MVNEKLEYAALRPMMALPAAAEGQPGWRHRLARAFAPMGSMRPAAVAALAALAFFLILALWLFLTMSGRIDAFFLPSPLMRTGQNLRFPVISRRKPLSALEEPTITHCRGWLSTVLP